MCQKRETDLYDVPLADLVECQEIHTLSLDTLVLHGGRDRGGKEGGGRDGGGKEGAGRDSGEGTMEDREGWRRERYYWLRCITTH